MSFPGMPKVPDFRGGIKRNNFSGKGDRVGVKSKFLVEGSQTHRFYITIFSEISGKKTKKKIP